MCVSVFFFVDVRPCRNGFGQRHGTGKFGSTKSACVKWSEVVGIPYKVTSEVQSPQKFQNNSEPSFVINGKSYNKSPRKAKVTGK